MDFILKSSEIQDVACSAVCLSRISALAKFSLSKLEFVWSWIYFIPLLKTVQKLYTPQNYTLQNHHSTTLYFHSSLLETLIGTLNIY